MLTCGRENGISVIEAMITVALIAILVVLAVPAVGDWFANARIRTAGESLLAGLQFARTEAVRRNTIVEFRLGMSSCDPNAGVHAPTAYAICPAGASADADTIDQRSGVEGSADVVAAVTPDGALRVSFDGLGRRTANVDASLPLERIDLDLPEAVLPAERTRDLTLLIGVGGQIILCDPNVTAVDDVRRCPQ